jgi:SAM-dependent methyltransferase
MTDPARSFGSVAASYDRGRPDYPADAVAWLVGDQPCSVLELGAGTGKLTEALVAAGHDVFATDPDEKMLDVLSAKLPEVRATVGTAEQIPAPDASADVIIAGQAFHWFDYERAMPEIARVLRPGGRIALVWNDRDDRIPWVRRLGGLMGKLASQERRPADEVITASGMFSATETQTFKHWQVIDRETVQDLVLTRSYVIGLSEEQRIAKRAEVLAFYDEFGRGMDGMQLPYVTTGYRAVVVNRPRPADHTVPLDHERSEPGDSDPGSDPGSDRSAEHRRTDTATRLPRVITDDADDTGLLLIDFS